MTAPGENLERMRKAAAKNAPPPKKKSRHKDRPRLPHGSQFHVAYDANTQTWSGTLVVPRDGQAPLEISSSKSGVWRLLEKLDDLYRAATGPAPGGTS